MTQTRSLGRTGALLSVAALVIIVAGMKAASTVVVPMIVAVFIAVVSMGPLNWLVRHRVPTALSVLIVVLAIIALLSLMGTLIGTSLSSFTSALPAYQERIAERMAGLFSSLERLGIGLSGTSIREVVNPGAAMGLASTLLGGVAGLLSNAILIILTVVFILLEQSSFPTKMRAAFGDYDEVASPAFRRFAENLNRYLLIKTIVSLVTGLLVGAWVAVLGLDFPVLWGLLAFVLNYIPSLGSIIAALPAVLLAYIQSGVGLAIWVAVGFLAVNMSLGNFVEPRFMGRGLGLSTLVVFVSLVVWGWILGPVGMLLAAPLTMTAKIALESRADTRWIACLLGSVSDAQDLADREGLTEPPPFIGGPAIVEEAEKHDTAEE